MAGTRFNIFKKFCVTTVIMAIHNSAFLFRDSMLATIPTQVSMAMVEDLF